MTKRIFRAAFLVSLIVLLLSMILLLSVLYTHFGRQLRSELENEAGFIAQGLSHEGSAYLEKLDSSERRITWITASGEVLYDSDTAAAAMENHADRPEFQAALANGSGEAARYSETLGQKTLYYALLLADGSVLRIAGTQSGVLALLIDMVPAVMLILAAAMLVSLVLASRAARRIVEPINRIDLDHPEMDDEAYDELAPLLTRIIHQNETIREQMEGLRRKQQEFTAITENMSEGFLILDRHAKVLSFNSAAISLLGAVAPEENASVFTLNRSKALRDAVRAALSGQACRRELQLGDKDYQLLANPVRRDAECVGMVLLIVDITEKKEWERLRSEFTANVSHELKTPLTSISGFAEIIRNNMVQPQDVPRFAGKIYDEAQRLISLVSDIIRLSQLDEEAIPAEKVMVDLYALAEHVLANLRDAAAEKHITCRLEGCAALVRGVPEILEDMIYNLCDNGIRYNRENGSLTVTVSEDAEGIRLTVADTGIGIPAAKLDRVFERFYRVDKSRSKQEGGTGLGLSIVKHAAAYHGAVVQAQSRLDEGSVFTVFWPQKATKDGGEEK